MSYLYPKENHFQTSHLVLIWWEYSNLSAACTKNQRSLSTTLQIHLHIILLLQWCRTSLFSGHVALLLNRKSAFGLAKKDTNILFFENLKSHWNLAFEIPLSGTGWTGTCLISVLSLHSSRPGKLSILGRNIWRSNSCFPNKQKSLCIKPWSILLTPFYACSSYIWDCHNWEQALGRLVLCPEE